MSALDDVLRRLDTEPGFRTSVELDPATALAPYDLSDADLRRLDAALRPQAESVEAFFSPPRRPGGAPRIGGRRRWLALAGAAVASVAVGAVLGAVGWVADPTPPAVALPADAYPLYACPDGPDDAPEIVGEVHRGDALWTVGRGPDGWIAVRNPQDLATTSWVRDAHATVDGGDTLPRIDCDEEPTAEITSRDATGSTTVTVDDGPNPPVDPGAGSTTTTVPGDPGASTPTPPTAPTTSDPAPTSVPGPEGPTSSTQPPADDRTPPELTLISDSGTLVYTDNNLGCRPTRTTIAVEVRDDRPGSTVEEVTYEFVGRSGTTRRGSLGPAGDGRWELGPLGTDAPVDLPVPLVVTARARDAAGNTGVASLTLTLRPYGMDCIG